MSIRNTLKTSTLGNILFIQKNLSQIWQNVNYDKSSEAMVAKFLPLSFYTFSCMKYSS